MSEDIKKRDKRIAELEKQNKRLRGTLRYIETQARLAHPGALQVIQANAEKALSDQQAALLSALEKK